MNRLFQESQERRKEERRVDNEYLILHGSDGEVDYKAMVRAIDISKHGLGVVGYRAFPTGVNVEIYLDNGYAGVGEIVNLDIHWDEEEFPSLARMGVHLVKKNSNWPC